MCGYQGHVCNDDVQFILRYRDHNDYCVGGRRVTVFDNGLVRNGTHAEARRILDFELRRYAEYAAWHVTFKAAHPGEESIKLQPFGDAGLAARLHAPAIIRCAHCGTSQEHAEVNTMVFGVPGACCEEVALV